MRGAFREYFVAIVLRHCPLGTPVRSSVELQKLSLVNSLFHFFESLIAQIQAGSDEIAEAEKRLSFEPYDVHPFLRPSAAISNQRRQADANNLESFLTLSATAAVFLLGRLDAAKTIFFPLRGQKLRFLKREIGKRLLFLLIKNATLTS